MRCKKVERPYQDGHGYCTYDYFSKCPHLMACAQCSFYVPKESSRAQMLKASANLQCMLKEISLTEEEVAAVESGIEFMNHSSRKLPTCPLRMAPPHEN